MLEQYFLYLCLSAFIARLSGRSAIVTGESIFDARLAKTYKQARQKKGRKHLISIIVLASNHADTITGCLDSIARTNSRKYEVIVVDNKSSDDTAAVVDRYSKLHAKRAIKLIRKRRVQPERQVYVSALRHVRGSIVVLLQGNTAVDKRMFTELHTWFDNKKELACLRLNTQIVPYPSLLTLMQRFEYFRCSAYAKAAMALPEVYALTIANGYAYRKQHLLAMKHAPVCAWQRTKKLQYASEAVVYRPPDWSAGWLAHWPHTPLWEAKLSRPIRMFEPIALTYFFYLAYTGKNSTLFLLSLGLFILWCWQIVSVEARCKRLQKLGLMSLAPLLYVLMYVREATLLVTSVIRHSAEYLRRVAVFWYGRFRQLARKKPLSRDAAELS